MMTDTLVERPLMRSSGATSRLRMVILLLSSALCFHLAHDLPPFAASILLFLLPLPLLAGRKTPHRAFYTGLLLGLLIAIPQLDFFWTLFHYAAFALWIVVAFWIGIFFLFTWSAFSLLPRSVAILALPIFWTGLEYFRSELYYLRFTWLTPGLAFYHAPILQAGSATVGMVVGLKGRRFEQILRFNVDCLNVYCKLIATFRMNIHCGLMGTVVKRSFA